MRYAAPAAVVLLTWAAYANSFYGVVVFDDITELEENVQLRTLTPISTPMLGGKRLPPRPLPYLTFAVDYALWGPPGPGWHLVNVAVHTAGALLLFGIVRRVLREPPAGARYAARADVLAFFIAALWAVHPLQTQAVTYLYQRMESLAGMLCLASFYCFLRGTEAERRRGPLVASIAFAAAAMLCKESAAALAPLIFLFDRARGNQSYLQTLTARPIYFAGLAASIVPLLLFLVSQSGRYVEFRSPQSAWLYATGQPAVVLHYVRLFFLPIGQCLYYAWPRPTAPGPQLALFAVPAALYFWLDRRHRQGAWLLAVLVVPLLPTSSFLPVNDMAMEHRMYLPSAALATAVVLAVDALARRGALGPAAGSGRVRAAVLAGVCAIATLAVATHVRNRAYYSRVDMWTDVTAKSPGNSRAFANLAAAYHVRQDYSRMLEAALRGWELDERSDIANFAAGTALMHLDRREAAIPFLERAVENDSPTDGIDPIFRVNLGVAVRPTDRNRAVMLFGEALAADPYCVEALTNLANDKARQGDFRGAAALFERALAVVPDDAQLQQRLADARADGAATGASS